MKSTWTFIWKSILARVQTMIWGPPGIGKSARIEQFCAEHDVRCHVVCMAGRDPGDLPGYMVPEVEKRQAILLPSVWVRSILDDDKHHHVVFFDEWNNAAPATQAAALTLIQSGIVGDIRLPMERVSFVAACNPSEQAANAMDLSAAMANRFAHFHVKADFDEWASWLMLQKVNTAVASSVAGFLRKLPHLFCNVPEDMVKASGPWPSPRSWFNAIRMCSSVDDLPEAAEACCGEGVAVELTGYLKDLDLPDPEALLTGNDKLPDRADKLFASLTGVVSVLANNPTEKRWYQMWTVIEHAAKKAKDIATVAALSARVMAKQDNNIKPGPNAKRWKLANGEYVSYPKIAADFVDLMRDAGCLS